MGLVSAVPKRGRSQKHANEHKKERKPVQRHERKRKFVKERKRVQKSASASKLQTTSLKQPGLGTPNFDLRLKFGLVFLLVCLLWKIGVVRVVLLLSGTESAILNRDSSDSESCDSNRAIPP